MGENVSDILKAFLDDRLQQYPKREADVGQDESAPAKLVRSEIGMLEELRKAL